MSTDEESALLDIRASPGQLMQYSELICFERSRGRTHVEDIVVRVYPANGGSLVIGYREPAAAHLPWHVPAGKTFSAYLPDVGVSGDLTLRREETTDGEFVYAVPRLEDAAAMVLLTPISPGIDFGFTVTLETDATDMQTISARIIHPDR